jgi:hypothetical protein
MMNAERGSDDAMNGKAEYRIQESASQNEEAAEALLLILFSSEF